MKNLKAAAILTLCSLVTIIGCDNSSSTVTKQVDANLKMYKTVWDDIVNKGNIDGINETNFTKDVTIVMEPENIVGIEAFKAYYQNFLTGFSDIDFTIDEGFGKDGKLAKQWTFRGKHTGDFFGIPATGKTVNIQGMTLTQMKDGKIAQEQDFMDNTKIMQQLGLLSNPENRSIIDNLYQNFAKGDIPAVLAAMDAKISWNEAEGNYLADGNPYIGPDAVLNGVFARLGADNEYFKVKDVQLHPMDNNQILATLRYEGKARKTGKPFDVQAAHLWTLNNGKITAFQQYADTKQLAEVMK